MVRTLIFLGKHLPHKVLSRLELLIIMNSTKSGSVFACTYKVENVKEISLKLEGATD